MSARLARSPASTTASSGASGLATTSRKSLITNEGGKSESSACSRSRKINFTPASFTTRRTKSALAPASIGTATAPCSRIPQKQLIHSAEFGPQSRTRSPRFTPCPRSARPQKSALAYSSVYVTFSRRYPRLCTTAASPPHRKKSPNRDKRFSRRIFQHVSSVHFPLDSTPAHGLWLRSEAIRSTSRATTEHPPASHQNLPSATSPISVTIMRVVSARRRDLGGA